MWPSVVRLLIGGYTIFGRSFAHLGVAPAKVFVGEIAIGLFAVVNAKAVLGRWFLALTRPQPESPFAWALLLSMQYGIFEVLRGIGSGYPALAAVQNLVFHIYPIYFFMGLWVGERDPDLLPRFIRRLSWFSGIYGVLYILFLNSMTVKIPGSDVEVFGQAGGSSLALIGLLAFERNLARVWPQLALNAFVLMAIQVRAEWLAFLLGIAVWSAFTGRIGRFVQALAVIVLLLGVGFWADIRIPSPKGRGGEIAARELVARAVAAVSSDAARQLSPNARFYAGTASWRQQWWAGIWNSVHKSPVTAVAGHGYGFPLTSVSAHLLTFEGLRTPHSVFFYALGYTGWVGVLLFALLIASVVHLLWRSYMLTGQPFGLTIAVMAITGALFGNVFETPFGAIPFFLIAGLSSAPVTGTLWHSVEEEDETVWSSGPSSRVGGVRVAVGQSRHALP